MSRTLPTVALVPSRPRAVLARLSPAAIAALLGAVLLFGVGLAQPQVLHNATHDSRHALGFPCH